MRKRKGVNEYSGVLTGDHGHNVPMESRYEIYENHLTYQLKITDFRKEQKWFVETEPDLGIGTIKDIQNKRVTVSFFNSKHDIQYSINTAPLVRLILKNGDIVELKNGETATIQNVFEKENLLYYKTDNKIICETDLSDAIKPHSPLQLLLSGQQGSYTGFELRKKATSIFNRINKSVAKGFVGAKIDLLPHQIYVANTISSRYVRRALLADEVGLGKTIEASLVLHKLMVSGQITRILILVPESLTHIWFVELLRKFNIVAGIVDNRHNENFNTKDNNPFMNNSCVISTIDFILNNKSVSRFVHEADWDLLILDEAHHITENTPEYSFISKLSNKCQDVLFLTATPQQNGAESHFSRLKLLDNIRYTTFEDFKKETQLHAQVAEIIKQIKSKNSLSQEITTTLNNLIPWCKNEILSLESNTKKSDLNKKILIKNLLDYIGTGRSFFRNTRKNIGGFPKRNVIIKPFTETDDIINNICTEFNCDLKKTSYTFNFNKDPRIKYLNELIKKDKVLLICSTAEKVELIKNAIKKISSVNIATFHEKHTLIQRDRNAAWFAENDGAQLLICSEIGSEGRNFQFAHHLFMFDLPINPELLEQRIGRLDRIGQKKDITIHVPYVNKTPYEILTKWHDEGLGIFNSVVSGAYETFIKVSDKLNNLLIEKYSEKSIDNLNKLISDTKTLLNNISMRVEKGRDKLLEINSIVPIEADKIIESIKKEDESYDLEYFMIELFKSQNIFFEETNPRTYKLWGSGVENEILRGISSKRSNITFDRTTGLLRDDINFITIDHPAVQSGIELIMSSSIGKHAFAVWESDEKKELILETLFILNCPLPPKLRPERFLPPTPIRVVVNHYMNEYSDDFDLVNMQKKLKKWGVLPAIKKDNVKQKILPEMLEKSREIAITKSKLYIDNAISKLEQNMGSEINRIKNMTSIKSIHTNELPIIDNEFKILKKSLSESAPRLDSLRLILKTQIPKN